MGVEVREVRGPAGRRRFVDIPFRLFGHDPTWVPPLRLTVYSRLSPRHPANEHQETALWTAWRDGHPVGRIGACVDRLFNEFQGLSWAWVGFFECFDDPEAASALFDAASEWASSKGMATCVGPASFTTNDECGLLVEGFEHRPRILTPHNPTYYERLWRQAGWQPAMDLWGWTLTRGNAALAERQRSLLERMRRRSDIRIRSVRMDDYDADVGRVFEVYNAAWARNWGFAPMTEAEVRRVAKDLKQVLDPELALLAERPTGEPVGVAICVPDVNQAMVGVRSGRLLPTGWWKLLRGARRATEVRVFALGVKPEAQSRALGLLLYGELFERLEANHRIQTAEASWTLATNTAVNEPLQALGGRRYKTWRMYERPL